MNIQPEKPEQGQESVWDYPRPPRLDPTDKRVRVIFNGEVIADTTNAVRVLETSHPPGYYIPQDDINMDYLTQTSRRTVCEFKGVAAYWSVTVGDKTARNAGWSYPNPNPKYKDIEGYISFYPGMMEACYVDGEKVQAQEGSFYGGWITSDVVGPFKGGPGTLGW
jgi:uncharacterized protein (DUF427 family)